MLSVYSNSERAIVLGGQSAVRLKSCTLGEESRTILIRDHDDATDAHESIPPGLKCPMYSNGFEVSRESDGELQGCETNPSNGRDA